MILLQNFASLGQLVHPLDIMDLAKGRSELCLLTDLSQLSTAPLLPLLGFLWRQRGLRKGGIIEEARK